MSCPNNSAFVKHKHILASDKCIFNHCLQYHQQFTDWTWTDLTDNDEYVLYNYVLNDSETMTYDHSSKHKKKIIKHIDQNRKKYLPWRYDNKLPTHLNQTILSFIQEHQHSNTNNNINDNNNVTTDASSGIRGSRSTGDENKNNSNTPEVATQ